MYSFIILWTYPEGKQQWIIQIDLTFHISADTLKKDHTSVTGSGHFGFTCCLSWAKLFFSPLLLQDITRRNTKNDKFLKPQEFQA